MKEDPNAIVEELKAHVTYAYMPARCRDAMDSAAALILHLTAELAEATAALERIARGDDPPDQHGHYLAHRAAVKAARTAIKGTA